MDIQNNSTPTITQQSASRAAAIAEQLVFELVTLHGTAHPAFSIALVGLLEQAVRLRETLNAVAAALNFPAPCAATGSATQRTQ
jgi:hypothetical protein